MHIYGVLLAGGQSSRMGQDKALLSLNKEDSLLFLMYEKLNVVVCEHQAQRNAQEYMIVSLKKGDQTPKKHQLQAIFVEDLVDKKGPLGGLFSISECFKNTSFVEQGIWLLVVPVDMPFLSHELLSLLLHTAIASTPDCEACVFENHEFPLCLKLNPHSIKVLAHTVNTQDAPKSYASIRYLLSQLHTYTLKWTQDNSFIPLWLNINQPKDWAQAQDYYGRLGLKI